MSIAMLSGSIGCLGFIGFAAIAAVGFIGFVGFVGFVAFIIVGFTSENTTVLTFGSMGCMVFCMVFCMGCMIGGFGASVKIGYGK